MSVWRNDENVVPVPRDTRSIHGGKIPPRERGAVPGSAPAFLGAHTLHSAVAPAAAEERAPGTQPHLSNPIDFKTLATSPSGEIPSTLQTALAADRSRGVDRACNGRGGMARLSFPVHPTL